MNDRYLYRAKRTDNGKWVEGHLVFDDIDNQYRIAVQREYSTGTFYGAQAPRVKRDTICQCTGLKDKNGKLIWENDIVRDDNGNLYKAFWQDRYYQFSWICVKSDKLPIGAKWDFWSIRNYEIEVIGNIFDNPELINE